MGFVNIYSEMIPYLAKHFEYLNQSVIKEWDSHCVKGEEKSAQIFDKKKFLLKSFQIISEMT